MSKRDRTTPGERVRLARELQKLSQCALARSCGVNHSTIYRVECGLSKMRPETVQAIAAALDVTVDWILTGKRDAPTESSGSTSYPSHVPHILWDMANQLIHAGLLDLFPITDEETVALIERYHQGYALTPERLELELTGMRLVRDLNASTIAAWNRSLERSCANQGLQPLHS